MAKQRCVTGASFYHAGPPFVQGRGLTALGRG